MAAEGSRTCESPVAAQILGLSVAGVPQSPKKSIDGILEAANIGMTPAEFHDGSVLVELDMRLTRDQYEAIHGNKKGDVSARKGLRDERYRWTNNTVPYIIKDYFNEVEVKVMREAMDEWGKYTCLTFIPWTTEDNYVEIISGQGCWSMVGMIGRKQQLSLQIGSCVYHHTAVHELGHAVGYHHEQTRPDRDEYVTVLTDNILSGLEYNFEKYDTDLIDDFGVTYDYWSVMHYSQYAFSGNGLPTIETKDPEYAVVIGSVPGLSFKDIQAANLMYKCAAHCTNECPEKAIQNSDCTCWCNTMNPRLPVEEWDGVSECKGGDDVEESCIDYYDECVEWADDGECDSNAYWMSQNCMKSCRVCGPDPACRDFDPEWCPHWAMIGECQRNPGWMMINCRFSCKVCGDHPIFGDCEDRWPMCEEGAANGLCESNSEAMLTECPVSCKACGDDVECKNWDSRCIMWKEAGRCTDPEHEKMMKLHCGQECGHCTGGTLPDCCDYAKALDCEWWAANGECSSNPGWMNRKCPLSCKVCGDDAVCMDRDVLCHLWGFDGECDTDKEYMHFACRAECGLCEGDPLDKPGCKNYDHNCDKWVEAGECDVNPDGMLHYCPRGCKACGPGTKCKDWLPDCTVWKADGECESNPTYMNKFCPLSCDTCCDDPDGCDIIGGPEPGQCDDYETCYDYLDDCAEKAAAGECFTDPGDMLRLCPISCKLCGDNAECHDYNDGCEGWAFSGECEANPSYMDMYCRKSCRCCEEPNERPKPVLELSSKVVVKGGKQPMAECDDYEPCYDYLGNCTEKAAAGECASNPGYMLRLCPISCKLCGPEAECNDYNADCAYWESIEKCTNNPSYMHMYCRKSCDCCEEPNKQPKPVMELSSEVEVMGRKRPMAECDDYDAVCNDFNAQCTYWASIGECTNNPSYMHMYCQKSCDCCA